MKNIFLLLSVFMLLMGCIDAPSTSGDTGTLSLRFQFKNNDSRYATIIPELYIENYIIEFQSYNGEQTDKEDLVLTETSGSFSLSVGTWNLYIHADNSEGIAIAELNLEGIEISKDEENTIDAELLPISGEGSINITLDLSSRPDNVTIELVSWALYKGVLTTVEVDSGVLVEPYYLELSNQLNGTDYRLVFEITTDSSVIISEGIVHIFSDIETSDTVYVSAADFGDTSINVSPPDETERVVFIHHSCGDNWLDTGNGNLGDVLGDNNYYTRDTYYGWEYYNGEEMEDIGSSTDTEDWLIWFGDPDNPVTQSNDELRSDNIMNTLYTTDNKNAVYTPITDPGGENDIIMFKSCFPNSEVGSSIDDEKEIYNKILNYFELHQDKLFILITPPGVITVSSWENTRELCQWLVDDDNGWLSDYDHNNVGVFDFYCVLSETDSHHTIENGDSVYAYASGYDGTSPYHNEGDNHPNSIGNQKATDEFIPLLNYYYNKWKGF